MKRLTYNQCPTYVRGINARDRILESLLLKSRAATSDELRHFMTEVLSHVTRYYSLLNKNYLDPHTVTMMKRLEFEIEHAAQTVTPQIFDTWMRLRQRTFAFSYAATQKALLNAGKVGTPHALPAGQLAHHVDKKTPYGSVKDRIHLGLERLKRKVIDAVQMSRTLDESLDEALARVGKAFPLARRVKRAHVLSRSFVEADNKYHHSTMNPYTGVPPLEGPMFIDQNDWDDIREEYKQEFIPEWRDPRYTVDELAGDDEEVVYAWEVERDLVDDFVNSVRQGEVAGATEQGVTDFEWIAVLSAGHTCDDCIKRDGLTTTEIEAKLDGEWADDDEDASVPPLHPNCYCRVAPIADNLPEKPASNAQDIEDWLSDG